MFWGKKYFAPTDKKETSNEKNNLSAVNDYLMLGFCHSFYSKFYGEDACLDNGGSYNEQSKICEK